MRTHLHEQMPSMLFRIRSIVLLSALLLIPPLSSVLAQTTSATKTNPPKQNPKRRSTNPGGEGTNKSDLAFMQEMTVLTFDPNAPGEVRAEVSVRNDSKTKSYHPVMRFGSFGFRDLGDQPVSASKALEVKKASVNLDPGDSEHLVILWKASLPVQPGVYDGSLILSEGKQELGRHHVQVVIAGSSGTILPLISKLNIRVYRLIPFAPLWWTPGHGYSPWAALPLRAPATLEKTSLTRSPLVAAVQRELTGTALFYWDKDPESLKANPPMLGLRSYWIPHTGTYGGTLALGKDKSSSEVTLTVNATDLIVYPLACLCFGVFVAIKGKQYLNGGRQILLWRARVRALDQAFSKADAQFAAEVAGTAATGYSIKDDFTDQRQAL